MQAAPFLATLPAALDCFSFASPAAQLQVPVQKDHGYVPQVLTSGDPDNVERARAFLTQLHQTPFNGVPLQLKGGYCLRAEPAENDLFGCRQLGQTRSFAEQLWMRDKPPVEAGRLWTTYVLGQETNTSLHAFMFGHRFVGPFVPGPENVNELMNLGAQVLYRPDGRVWKIATQYSQALVDNTYRLGQSLSLNEAVSEALAVIFSVLKENAERDSDDIYAIQVAKPKGAVLLDWHFQYEKTKPLVLECYDSQTNAVSFRILFDETGYPTSVPQQLIDAVTSLSDIEKMLLIYCVNRDIQSGKRKPPVVRVSIHPVWTEVAEGFVTIAVTKARTQGHYSVHVDASLQDRGFGALHVPDTFHAQPVAILGRLIADVKNLQEGLLASVGQYEG